MLCPPSLAIAAACRQLRETREPGAAALSRLRAPALARKGPLRPAPSPRAARHTAPSTRSRAWATCTCRGCMFLHPPRRRAGPRRRTALTRPCPLSSPRAAAAPPFLPPTRASQGGRPHTAVRPGNRRAGVRKPDGCCDPCRVGEIPCARAPLFLCGVCPGEPALRRTFSDSARRCLPRRRL